MKKNLLKVLPDAPKERTFNTVGKAGRAPARAGTGGGGRPRSPHPEAPGLGPGQPFAGVFSSSRDSMDYGPSTDHVHRNTRHNRKATDSKSQTGAERLCSSTKFQW